MKELIPQIFWEKYKKMLSSSEFEAFKEDGTKIGVLKHDDGHMIHRPEDYEEN